MPTLTELQTRISPKPPRIAIVLGSGLGGIVERIQTRASWAFADLPGLITTDIAGHTGRLYWGTWGEQSVLVFAGRTHYYDGQGWDAVRAPIQLAANLGCKHLILTNAAGGVRESFQAGTLMCLFHHLKWTQPRWWTRGVQKNDPIWYDYRLNDKLLAAAGELGIALEQGIYACLTGPSYETPAEVRALRSLGVDAVGMSTAIEAEEAYHLGMQTVAISCIANPAADALNEPICHEDVLKQTHRVADTVGNLLEQFITKGLP